MSGEGTQVLTIQVDRQKKRNHLREGNLLGISFPLGPATNQARWLYIERLPKSRILIYTGKGGVGKTTLSAATAVKCADLGYKTIVVSTDVAHTLGETLGERLGNDETKILDNLFAMEINTKAEMRKHFGLVQQYFVELMGSKGMTDEDYAKEILVFPGMDEMFALLKVSSLIKDRNRDGYEVIIVDSAPLGNTFRFLAFPEVMDLFRRALKAEKYMYKMMGPFKSLIRGSRPIPTGDYYKQTDELWDKVKGARSIFKDSEITTVRLVTLPEKIVISETFRGLRHINTFGYHIDCLIVNQILPKGVDGEFLTYRKKLQEKYLGTIAKSFRGLTEFRCDLSKQEVIGVKKLREVANQVFNSSDPTAKFPSKFEHRWSEDGPQGYKLTMTLSTQEGEEIFVAKERGGSLLDVIVKNNEGEDVDTFSMIIPDSKLPAELNAEKWPEKYPESDKLVIYLCKTE